MMTSKRKYREIFVWIWLPEQTEPVVAGKLTRDSEHLLFNYGKSYLARDNAIAIYPPELPLMKGVVPLQSGLHIPSSIRDGSPDAWGRRVIISKVLGLSGSEIDTELLDEMTYLMESSSDRIGALDFQVSATEYQPRILQNATLEELLECSKRIEMGLEIPRELDLVLNHGTSIGGARPKALINQENAKYIAKFSSTSDVYNVVKGEYMAMRLAKLAGLNVANVKLEKVAGKDVLLVERFDRNVDGREQETRWLRRHMVSALTLFQLDEMFARYASYEQFAEIICQQFAQPEATLRELFSRLVFNILCGNTDDHARNHAAFWDGSDMLLTPAYDICPQSRSGNTASQAMLIVGNQRQSQLNLCMQACSVFRMNQTRAKDIIDHLHQSIVDNWRDVCEEADLTAVDQKLFWGRQFLNSYAFENF